MKRIHAAALAAVLAGVTPAWAQHPSAGSDVMTLSGTDGKPHSCKILRSYKHPGGGTAYDVRDQITGEEMTVVENASPDDVKVNISFETKTESAKPADPILQPRAYTSDKTPEKYGSASQFAPRETPPIPYRASTQTPVPATRRWFNWFRNDPPAPKPMPPQSSRMNLPPAETVALYHPDPVIRLIGCMSDDLLPSMREVSAETLARHAKDRPEVVEAMIRTVQTDPAPSVRICCCRCLVDMKVRSPECLSALKSLEDDREQSVRTAAAAAVSVLEQP